MRRTKDDLDLKIKSNYYTVPHTPLLYSKKFCTRNTCVREGSSFPCTSFGKWI